MSQQQFGNNDSTRLASAISAGDTSLVVAAGTGANFPALSGGDYFIATLKSSTTREIIKVTAVSTDTFTVVRGQEGTTAAAFAAGDLVELRLTAGFMNLVGAFITNVALVALAALTAAANKIPYFTGSSTAGLLTLDTDGTLAANSDTTLASQKATRTYVDAKVAGLSWKQAVRAATTTAGTIASSFANGSVIDGVTLVTGDRILIKNQATASENGIYIVAASGAPTRATDADAGAELVNASCYVSEGTVNADTQWTCTTNATITVGTTSLAFAQLTSGGTVLSGLTDVTITSPANGDLLTYDSGSSKWKNQASGGGSLPTWLSTSPDAPPGSAANADDEFDSGSSLDTSGARRSGATAWATVNPSTTAYNVGQHRLSIVTPAVGGGNNLRIAKQALVGTTTWRYQTCVTLASAGIDGGSTNHFGGLCLRESATGKLVVINVGANTAALAVYEFASPTSFSGSIGSSNGERYGPIYFAVQCDGTNYFYEASWNGKDWNRLASHAKAAFFTTAADEVGLLCDANNGTHGCVLAAEWFRQTA